MGGESREFEAACSTACLQSHVLWIRFNCSPVAIAVAGGWTPPRDLSEEDLSREQVYLPELHSHELRTAALVGLMYTGLGRQDVMVWDKVVSQVNADLAGKGKLSCKKTHVCWQNCVMPACASQRCPMSQRSDGRIL